MIAWLRPLLARWQTWAVVAALLGLVVGHAYLRGHRAVVDVGIPAALEEITGTRAELERSQEAIRAFSQRIQALTEEANAHQVRARAAEAKASIWQGQAADLRRKVAELEARPRLAPVQSAQEARSALRALGGY